MRKALAFGGIFVLLVAIVGYAGQRQDQERARREGAVKRAVQDRQLRPGIHTLSYEGPGRVVQINDGLFFNPGEEAVQLIMGFHLDWNKQAKLVPPVGLNDPSRVEITGWLEVTYDPEAAVLDVSLTDNKGQTFQQTYQHEAREKADPSKFAEFVDEFFQFMNTRTEVVGGVAAVMCRCSCTFGGGQCNASLTECGGTCTACACTCSLPSTCSCECRQAETM